ncbi:MFS transporter [Bacillus sp. Marseille-P3661]|uniref:MFS transporter n=1 Tax=Bacillus sp. Marseille-P3661 TaxID=1936234 RepID=UPI002155E150|nr:MFS transporter [Bacillus sp. Marseille-P3661]
MKETTINKWHIFLVMFFFSLIVRIQIPIFTPYAAAFGATSIFVGIILSATSLSNLSGNLIAGPLVDRISKKAFITLPLFVSGWLFIAHGLASDSYDLLILHALNGFTLGFLFPAAFTLLSSYANNSRQQGKNIAINGLLSTIASIIAPLIGGKMVALIGYENTYFFIGAAMILTGIYSIPFLRERNQIVTVKTRIQGAYHSQRALSSTNLSIIYLIGFAVMYIHGVIIFEIPYLTIEKGLSTFNTGQLFSYMGIGTFISLSLFFVNRFDPIKRLMIGLFGMSMILFMLLNSSLPLSLLLLLIGLFFGLIMPAMATGITDNTPSEMHGRAFGYMSAVYSLGIISSSFITGAVRDIISPYFIAFLVGMLVVTFVGFFKLRSPKTFIPYKV